MDHETEVAEVAEVAEEEIQEAPESIIVKRKGRPTGAKNKAKADTGGTPDAPDPMYAQLMKRLDDMDTQLQKREEKPEKKPRQPRKTAFKEPIVEEEYRPRETPSFQINGSPRTASRQLMEHLHFQQRERISARERMYENFLPI